MATAFEKPIGNTNISKTLDFLESVFRQRLKAHFSDEAVRFDFRQLKLPVFKEDQSAFLNFLNKNQPTPEEFLVISLALIPHLQPGFLNQVIHSNLPQSGDFPELGGEKGENNRGFFPTGETALFLISGTDLKKRMKATGLFSARHWFYKIGLLSLEKVKPGFPKTAGRIVLDEEFVELFTTGKISLPVLSVDFPAQHLSTEQKWEDLVLPKNALERIEEIKTWVKHNDTLMQDWGMAKKLKPGYRCLFYGPPGTGKTMTATLLGNQTGKEVFRIDLSTVVSKYIGETEKNLATLFEKAQNKNWILFFDEADALFGKRTNVSDAHDKYANQEVSYLLQRIETFPGLIILASNLKSNIDEAFSRRFQSVIYFPFPGPDERLQIWKNAFPEKVNFAKDVDLQAIAGQYELTGANIMNVIQYACLQALASDNKTIQMNDLRKGIAREYEKEGKIL